MQIFVASSRHKLVDIYECVRETEKSYICLVNGHETIRRKDERTFKTQEEAVNFTEQTLNKELADIQKRHNESWHFHKISPERFEYPKNIVLD